MHKLDKNKEFIQFHGFEFKEITTKLGNKLQLVDEFDAYMKYGGMPGIAEVS